jgi:hypothetical protein
MWRDNCPVHNLKTHSVWCYIMLCFLLLIERCWFSVSKFVRFISGSHWLVNSEGYISYLHGRLLLEIEPILLGFTTCSLVTILIMLTQLPLLANSWSVFPGSYNGKAVPWNCIHFNTIYIPGLLLLISNLIPYWCVQVNGRSIDCDHLSCLSVYCICFRRLHKIAKIDNLLC